MKFPYLAPRTAMGPIRLDTYVERETASIMADDARVTAGHPARITPEFKAWHDRVSKRHRSK
jgi:hypothetical protein